MNRDSTRRLLVPSLILLLLACARHGAAQAATAQALRQEAQQARSAAAKQRAQADDYRGQAQKLQMRAAGETQQAADAHQAGKTDDARRFEQQAKSDNDDADRRLDEATRFDREAERLLMVAADKDRAADRMSQDEPPKDTPTALWQQARTTFQDALYEMATVRSRLASMLGAEYPLGSGRYARFRQDQLDTIFDRYKEAQDSVRDAEAAWRGYGSKKIDANRLAGTCYRSLEDVLVRLTHTEFRAAGMEVQLLLARAGRGNEADDDMYARGRDAIDAQYKAGAIDSDQKAAEMEQLMQKAGKSRHAHFDEIAPPYRQLMLRLARFRRDWSAVVKEWHDRAAHFSKGANDVHSDWAQTFERAATRLFSKEGGANLFMNVATFAFYPRSPDRLNTGAAYSYADHSWLKPDLYPDIQDPDSPDMLRM